MKAADVVLLLVDFQEPILARGRTHPAATIRARASSLVRAAELLDIPVVLSAVATGKGDPTLISEVPGTPIVRSCPAPTDDDATLAALRRTRRRNLVIGAVLTEVAGYSAAMCAAREGFDVTLLVDACSGTSERTEMAVFRTLGLSGVRTLPVASFLAGLITDFTKEPGKSLLPIMRECYD